MTTKMTSREFQQQLQKVEGLVRAIESTAMTPIPLLVASPSIDGDAIARLRTALLACHAEPALAATRDALLLTRFAPVEPADYDMLPAQKTKADAGGIPAPA